MRISIFGMGYVGVVCAACLSEYGHYVIGVDVSALKVDSINAGKSPIVEPGVDALLARGRAAGRIRATTDAHTAVLETELSMICVGTPSKRSGDLDLRFVEAVGKDIATALRNKSGRHTVVVRSTVLPGTVRKVVIPILEQVSGKRAGVDFGVAVNPEFLRESTAVDDYRDPPMTVIGELDQTSGDILASLYAPLTAPTFRRSIELAEMIKYSCNIWHATKITFANEMGAVAKAAGIDGREVMELVCHDQKLNISKYYMRPGFAFGGSCLPKDLRAFRYRALQLDANTPMIASILGSNSSQIQRAFDLVSSFGMRRVGMLGLSFKAGTDDLRESPFVDLAEMLIGKGYQLNIFDRNVEYARVHGANREYINAHLPHVSALLKPTIEDVFVSSDVIVIAHGEPEFQRAVQQNLGVRKLVDLAGIMLTISTQDSEGFCW
jgi:GDP-mannose 6-dehydrogenase